MSIIRLRLTFRSPLHERVETEFIQWVVCPVTSKSTSLARVISSTIHPGTKGNCFFAIFSHPCCSWVNGIIGRRLELLPLIRGFFSSLHPSSLCRRKKQSRNSSEARVFRMLPSRTNVETIFRTDFCTSLKASGINELVAPPPTQTMYSPTKDSRK